MLAQNNPTECRDPITLVRDFGMLKDDISVASTAEKPSSLDSICDQDENESSPPLSSRDGATEDEDEEDNDNDYDEASLLFRFFRIEFVEVSVPVPPTQAQMNPLSGCEVVPWLKEDFRRFVEDRDRKLAEEASAQRKQRIFQERSRPSRYEEPICNLFEAVADAFVSFMTSAKDAKRRIFGFKYCPLPGCSADKATGNLDSKGIGHAVLKRFSVLKGFPMEELSPFSTEFKSWVSTHRRMYGVPESFIGCRQIKQIDLSKAPAMHMRNFVDRIHKRHNPEGFARFEEESRLLLNGNNDDSSNKKKKTGVNASNLMPHELLDTLRNAGSSAEETLAGLQFLSIIKKTKIPKGINILPVVDVSGSMSGVPMSVRSSCILPLCFCL